MLKNIKNIVSVKRISASIVLFLLVLFSQEALISAQSISQGYKTDSVLQRGTIVSLQADDTSRVSAANYENADRLHGVVIGANDAPVTLSDDLEKTFVATVGRYEVLVSTENGVIQPGDFLTVSSFSGIAAKAGVLDRFTIGKAIVGFNGDGAISTSTLTDSVGSTRDVSVGRVLVDISVGANPLLQPAESTLPGFLKKATEAIAGKAVSPVRVYVSIIIVVAAAGIAGSLLYSGIRSSVISIGRNPLSKKSISKSLTQIILTSVIIFLIGLFGVYLLLRL